MNGINGLQLGLSSLIAKPNKLKQQNRVLKFGFVGLRHISLNRTPTMPKIIKTRKYLRFSEYAESG
jgi:hypothetical protein